MVKRKVTPIIQTRGMKAKAKKFGRSKAGKTAKAAAIAKTTTIISQKDLDKFNNFDALSSREILGGDDHDDDGVYHDGVELSIQGSDIEEFTNEGGGDFGQQQLWSRNETTPVPGSGHKLDSSSDEGNDGSDSPKFDNSIEPGEIYSSDEEEQLHPKQRQHKVASKVVKAVTVGEK